ncbi:MAG TPA: YHS domain-containing protein, partial [Gammaproteobacteria bacterium]|nr:YHS domain-containing protein [Gammaproteobacteria bacterium]
MQEKTSNDKTPLIDPVCGMSVTQNSDYHVLHGGNEYFFCSRNCQDKFKAHPEQYTAVSDAGEDKLKDPVCGMDVTADSEFHVHYQHHDYYFCSEHCETKFKDSPEQYLGAETEAGNSCPDGSCSLSSDIIFTCPMHPEIEQQGPGSCPKCGMALEPKGMPVVETKVEYTCPMHPEVVQDHPGSCPKCGMALEPKTVTVEEKNEELIDMNRRFWLSTALALPVFVLAMVADLKPEWLPDALSMKTVQWIECLL